MRHRLLLAGLILLSVIFTGGCHYFPERTSDSRHDFEICGPATEEEIDKLDKILDALPEPMVDSIDRICIIGSDHFTHNEIAHAAYYWGGSICILPEQLNNPRTVWHEVGHTYRTHLVMTGSDFVFRWREASGNFYDGGLEYRKEATTGLWMATTYPKLGMLTAYSRVNDSEDVSEFVSHVYLFLDGQYSSMLIKLKSDGSAHLSDRYFRKLALLHEYGFINDADYRKVLDFLK